MELYKAFLITSKTLNSLKLIIRNNKIITQSSSKFLFVSECEVVIINLHVGRNEPQYLFRFVFHTLLWQQRKVQTLLLFCNLLHFCCAVIYVETVVFSWTFQCLKSAELLMQSRNCMTAEYFPWAELCLSWMILQSILLKSTKLFPLLISKSLNDVIISFCGT